MWLCSLSKIYDQRRHSRSFVALFSVTAIVQSGLLDKDECQPTDGFIVHCSENYDFCYPEAGEGLWLICDLLQDDGVVLACQERHLIYGCFRQTAIIPTAERNHRCRNWCFCCTLMISSSSHCSVVNIDSSFPHISLTHAELSLTHTWARKFWIKAAQWDQDFLSMTWVGDAAAAAGQPVLALGSWTCTPPHMMKCSADCRRSLRRRDSHTGLQCLLVCLERAVLTIPVGVSSMAL